MPLLSLPELRARTSGPRTLSKSLNEAEIRRGAIKSFEEDEPFDVFLSHRYLDASDVLRVKELLEDYYGLRIFVDWLEAELQNRSEVTASTAELLRTAMKRSSCLILAATENAGSSQWIPWELGYCDALHGKVAVFPFAEQPTRRRNYEGREYLGLYPFVQELRIADNTNLWLKSPHREEFQRLDRWVETPPASAALLRS